MFKRNWLKLGALLSSTTFAGLAIPGCDALTQIFDQLLGAVSGS